MEHEERNRTILQKMLSEIEDIEAFLAGRSAADLMGDRMCQKAIVMSLINIGELSKSFTESYLGSMPERKYHGRLSVAFAILPRINTASLILRTYTRP